LLYKDSLTKGVEGWTGSEKRGEGGGRWSGSGVLSQNAFSALTKYPPAAHVQQAF